MKNNIEKIKTIVLWLLFISSIALLVIKYNLFSFDKISGELRLYNDSVFENIIIPKHIYIRLSQYNMTSILEDKKSYYDEIKDNLSSGLRYNSGIKKIDENEYKEIKKYPNILAVYAGIPPIYIEKSLRLKNTVISNINFIEEICLILEKNEIYIKDKNDYYMIQPQNNNVFPKISNLEGTLYTKFYPKFENLNDKNILLPLTFNMNLKNVATISILDGETINNISRSILKDRFDFSSSIIQKNGIYFYSYNNGQEILKLSKDGSLEYKRESVVHVQDDIEKSTKAMLNFLWQVGLNENSIIIKSVKKTEAGGQKIYEFNIKHQKDGIIVDMSTQFDDGTVRVVGDTVIYANFILRNVDDYLNEDNSILDPSKALETKIENIKSKLGEKEVSAIISNIEDISLVYIMDRYKELIPAWKYEIKDNIFYINAENGELYNYAMVKN